MKLRKNKKEISKKEQKLGDEIRMINNNDNFDTNQYSTQLKYTTYTPLNNQWIIPQQQNENEEYPKLTYMKISDNLYIVIEIKKGVFLKRRKITSSYFHKTEEDEIIINSYSSYYQNLSNYVSKKENNIINHFCDLCLLSGMTLSVITPTEYAKKILTDESIKFNKIDDENNEHKTRTSLSFCVYCLSEYNLQVYKLKNNLTNNKNTKEQIWKEED